MFDAGMEKQSNKELARLLAHRDMRVRLEAQWELAERSLKQEAAYDALSAVAAKGSGLARLHAVWGLGQVARSAGKLGTLKVSKGAVVWFRRQTKWGKKFGWRRFSDLIEKAPGRWERR